MATDSKANGKVIAVDEVIAFVKRCMMSAGTIEPHASTMADMLVAADSRGHYSHGLNRLRLYAEDLILKKCDGLATPFIVKESPGTALVDGRNGIGTVVGTFAMDLAIEKAKENGVAWVTCTGSNHYGIAGYYSLRAVKQGLIGISVTNTSPKMVPTRAKTSAVGTNPLAFGAPGKGEDSFCLDMATTAVSLGKVEILKRKDELIPPGWGLDGNGEETVNPDDVLQAGGLRPVGGAELTSGYKGYGLGMMIEVMCGILGGGDFGSHVRIWNKDEHGVANVGHTFIALDPSRFAPGFEERMQTFMDEIRQMDPKDPSLPVLVAGDPEREHMRRVKENGGIYYHYSLVTAMDELSTQLNVEPMKGIQL